MRLADDLIIKDHHSAVPFVPLRPGELRFPKGNPHIRGKIGSDDLFFATVRVRPDLFIRTMKAQLRIDS